jgi:MSHA biogenesis protein MshJ
MKEQLFALLARFDARPVRERWILAIGLVALVYFIGDSLFVSAPLLRGRAESALATQREAEQKSLEAQLVSIRAELAESGEQRNRLRQDLLAQRSTLDDKLKALDGTLVTPQAAPALLEHLMGRRKGLQMLGLRTLAPTPVLDHPQLEGQKNDNGMNVYRHGIEIRLAGNYLDLLAYLSDLEAAPERLLWEGARLNVDTYPRSILTLRVYTLSLDKAWLVL